MVSKLNPDGAQHSEQCYVTVSVENIAVHTVYAKYLVLTLIGKVLHNFFLPQICTVLKAVLHVELTQCKTRSRVGELIFDSIQEKGMSQFPNGQSMAMLDMCDFSITCQVNMPGIL